MAEYTGKEAAVIDQDFQKHKQNIFRVTFCRRINVKSLSLDGMAWLCGIEG